MQLSGLVLIAFCFFSQKAQAQLVYKFVKVECNGNASRVRNESCSLKAINWNVGVLNGELVLLGTVWNPIIQVQVFKKDYANQFKPFLIDVKLHMCQVIERKSFIPYGVMMWKILKKYTNLNHSCPYSGHLYAKDGYLTSDVLPPFPQGVYIFSFMFSDENSTHTEYVGTLKLYTEVMEKVKSRKKPKAKGN
ncbi:uncharacterized protein [Drosophila kikkawai]|uniref:Uncharacterized protein n=1 Tax=Drosophila kikkawai TaxID=30033 RepID=A0A6P4IU55_DROKI|nr:uncharacterized protein LOC108077911 [Drosophila kikkawai]